MHRFLVLLLLSTVPLFAAPRRRAITPEAPLPVAALEAIGSKYAKENPGLAIAVKKGNAVFLRGFGELDRTTHIPAYGDSVFQIASVTKQFAAAAVMRLVEEGKLNVDDRIRTHLPELDSRFDAITIRHLLQHTSGLRDYNAQLTTAYEPKTQQEILALITSGPPLFTPGTLYLYSNSGYFVLGMIIERASSRTFEQYLRETFFAPLGLGATGYCGVAAPSPNGYLAMENGGFMPLPAADMSLPFSAGALCSTALDLVRWNAALVAGRAVSPESYRRMTTDTVVIAEGMRYGYGLVIDRDEGRDRVWHNGSILGFSSHLSWYPGENLTIAVLINVTDLQNDRPAAIATELARVMKP